MFACPACHTDALPMYRALLNIQGITHDCPHCHARLRMRDSPLGRAVLVASFCLRLPLSSLLYAPPVVILLYGFVLPPVTGISLWLHTIKVDVVEPESAFTPHTRELRF